MLGINFKENYIFNQFSGQCLSDQGQIIVVRVAFTTTGPKCLNLFFLLLSPLKCSFIFLCHTFGRTPLNVTQSSAVMHDSHQGRRPMLSLACSTHESGYNEPTTPSSPRAQHHDAWDFARASWEWNLPSSQSHITQCAHNYANKRLGKMFTHIHIRQQFSFCIYSQTPLISHQVPPGHNLLFSYQTSFMSLVVAGT